ncbi:hypothetical protein DFQ26_005016 [Actinomortierella ambigua]|nr:hypothetical protein DFQ26_005016 [Actinomortierella ambigua]
MTTPTTLLTLFCLVDGETNSFPVDIEPSKTVAHLKKLIKAEKAPRFDDVAADKLTLWCVSIPVLPKKDRKEIRLADVPSDERRELNESDDVASMLAEAPPNPIEASPKKSIVPSLRKKSSTIEAPPKKIIHIIVQRPPPKDALNPEIASLRKQLSDMEQLTDTKLASVVELRSLLQGYFEQFEGDDDVEIFVYQPGGSKPTKLVTDIALRSCLEEARENDWKNLVISLDSPAKEFSSYTWNDIMQQYGIEVPGPDRLPTFDIQPRKMNEEEKVILEDIIKDCARKNQAYIFGSSSSESARNSIVDSFMVGAMQSYKTEMYLEQQQPMTGRRGHGDVDFAVLDRVHDTQILGVTQVKKDNHVQGAAQNIVQLDVAVQQRKRKRAEMDDEGAERPSTRMKSFGIVTDAFKWTFVECTLETDDTLTYKAKEVLRDLELQQETKLREGAETLFCHVLSLYDLMKDEIVNRSSYRGPVSRFSSAPHKRQAAGVSRS